MREGNGPWRPDIQPTRCNLGRWGRTPLYRNYFTPWVFPQELEFSVGSVKDEPQSLFDCKSKYVMSFQEERTLIFFVYDTKIWNGSQERPPFLCLLPNTLAVSMDKTFVFCCAFEICNLTLFLLMAEFLLIKDNKLTRRRKLRVRFVSVLIFESRVNPFVQEHGRAIGGWEWKIAGISISAW